EPDGGPPRARAARHRLLHRLARARAVDRRRRGAGRPAPARRAPGLRPGQRRGMQRGIPVGGRDVRGPPPAGQPGGDRGRDRPAALRVHAGRPLAGPAGRSLAGVRLGRPRGGRARRPPPVGAPGRTRRCRPAPRRHRPHRLREGRDVHGGAHQVALLADVRRRVRGGVPRGGRRRMRATFVRTLGELADRDPRILLLTADLGYTVLEPFAERFPDRFFNVGVAEQNMVGLATGLADAGFLPFLYSIATFASLRAYEFVRNGPVFHRLAVRIVGVGGGFEYGPAGPTHHALEDVGVMRI